MHHKFTYGFIAELEKLGFAVTPLIAPAAKAIGAGAAMALGSVAVDKTIGAASKSKSTLSGKRFNYGAKTEGSV